MGSKKPTKRVPQTHQKKSKKSALWLFMLFTVMCLSVLFALSLTVLFKTKSITVQGSTIYSNEQIISASGMQVGKNMFVSMFRGASSEIERLLPYVEEAKIERNLDGTVIITVKPAAVARCYSVDGGYVLTNSTGKFLEKTDALAEDKPLINGIAINANETGAAIKFADERSEQLLEDVFTAAANNGLKLNAVSTDASYSFLDVIIEDKYLVHLVNSENIDYKLLHIKTSIPHLDNEEGGTFTFSEVSEGKAIFAPGSIFEEEEPEVPETDETDGSTEPSDGE